MIVPHMLRTALLTGVLFLISACAPDATAQPVEYSARVGVVGATSGELPFWMAANQYGRIDPRSAGALFDIAARKPLRHGKPFDYGIGVEMLGRASEQSALYAHQLYGALQTGPLRWQAGWREHTSGMVDPTLSMGSTMWSRNASPMPKLSVAVPEYVAIPGTQGFLAVRGYVAHGWLGPNRYIDRPYLHEKYAYLRIRFPGLPVQGHAGFHHNVVWAGTHPTQGDLPDGFNNFLRVVLGQGAPEGSNTATGEQSNAFGNTVAAYDFAVTFAAGGVRGQVARQFYIEDTVSLAFRNVWDGLWSLSLRRAETGHLVDALVYEHLRMTRQGARTDLNEPRGPDSYYNNFAYRSGWTYRGRTLGTPLLLAGEDVPGITNNIVVAHHVGLRGTVQPQLRYRALLTYSRNYGASKICGDADCNTRVDGRTDRRDRYTTHLIAEGALPDWARGLSAYASVSADLGFFNTDRVGLAGGLRWQGLIHRGARD